MRANFKEQTWIKAGLSGSRLTVLIAALALGSCDTLGPEPEVLDDKVPLINLNVPSALA